ncbi:VWA domain-containing protein [Pararhizobium sp. BT-229]|uniref:VWA domain-containing protein n=1 Tax=Pararhizobium sp. BT-229 TaxID=2986923 RepID=UPI0021F6D097|nr:VWA domain-containing protein [Pararhizobium sp. BT-229]MCV9964092.1 VWA domain-containing protein [Pararhizobium sp. BT-229]
MITDLSQERLRRWKLALGDNEMSGLSQADQRMGAALSALYDTDESSKKGRHGGLGKSSPKVAKWLGDIREFFPSPVVQVIQKDAFDRLGLQALMMEPEFLETLEADVHLVAQLMSLRGQMPPRTVETARAVIAKVVEELMKRLRGRTEETLVGALNRSKRTRHPRFSDIDWHRTINANLRHWQPEYHTIIPETLIGFSRKTRTRADLDHVMLCVDQSGSMAPSVVFASIFAAVMASLPVLSTQLVCFDTAVVDWTEQLVDPVSVLFGIQLGGGTDIAGALGYCEKKIEHPSKTHMILISDLYENGNSTEMLKRAAAIKQSGVNLIVLLALSDEGRPAYDPRHASILASMGCPVFACTPDLFPDMMAAALAKQDISVWASANDVEVIRAA